MKVQAPVAAVEQVVGAHAALRAAAQTGVLDRLAKAPADPTSLAAATGLDARLLDALLHALTAIGVVEAGRDGRFCTPAQTTEALGVFDHAFAGLDEALCGRPPPDRVDGVEGAALRYPRIVRLLGAALAETAEQVADRLARPGLRILDAGAGGAPWSIAIARREPTCHVVAVDLPAVLAATRDATEAAGVADRVDLVAADLFDLPLRAQNDLVVAGNLCHLFDPARTATLIARLAGALGPGGTLALVDLPGDHADGVANAVYALGLTLRTSDGGLHTTCDYRRWLATAGLTAIETTPLTPRGLHLFTGRAPATTLST